MVEQWISWRCLETINVSSVGKTNHSSILIQESKACSHDNRICMKILIQRLIDDEKFSNDIAEGIVEFFLIKKC